MVAPTCSGITLPSSGSVPSAWEMLNWGAVDRILWMGVLCLATHHVTRHESMKDILQYCTISSCHTWANWYLSDNHKNVTHCMHLVVYLLSSLYSTSVRGCHTSYGVFLSFDNSHILLPYCIFMLLIVVYWYTILLLSRTWQMCYVYCIPPQHNLTLLLDLKMLFFYA
jgi:hypothetical protein